ncbi:DUF3857 and transglutaminase domain-containing protein [Mucilaginibacter sp. RS28]|uniref:DUF3857 and transglutaminase domain-containing protein n=1 Tax=Mucilaginibacter straminoryzae TaxID=2932774 RepID=A0A9X1X3T0_9SPHI|nr:DUF3857 and transglutaminase domain-containing protein [Mucilaginibacter straminoryzae]MCJ8209840.1 DUF3857 and transglutaminase domain-containing protein [Mucilaginibacter straminoryzae]
MIRKLFICFVLLFSSYISRAQENYSVSAIPKELMPYASAIVRKDETVVFIREKNNVIYRYKFAVTVLNKNGADEGELVLWHNKSRTIKNIKGMIYDEFGKPVSKISERDFRDDNYTPNSLFEDVKYKHFTPVSVSYPYTVEYEYELFSNQTFNLEHWYGVGSEATAVENSSFIVSCKPSLQLRYKEMNYKGTLITGKDDAGNDLYKWSISNFKAIRHEPYSPDKINYLPNVRLAVNNFTYEGVDGSYSNWNELGKWINDKLLTGRDELSAATVAKVKELTDGINDPKEKARKLYEYLQNKTRYISIQVGIGGYRPFKATEVDELSYGDCKGLVNYMHALLKAAGIQSWYCIVNGNTHKRPLQADFASPDQANHVILCLPFKSDTTWLECTSQHIPFGFLGDFTDDRTVLACTAEGGKLLKTPKYTADDNREIQKGEFTLAENGELTGTLETTFKGTQYENRDYLLLESYEDQQKYIRKAYPINNLEIAGLSLKATKEIKPSINETLQLKSYEYGTPENGRISFALNSVNRLSETPKEIRNRYTPIYINRGYTDEATISFTLPAGYHADSEPLNTTLTDNFGSYHADFSVVGNKLIYHRKLQLKDGSYSKEDYDKLVAFFEAVRNADYFDVVLAKNK